MLTWNHDRAASRAADSTSTVIDKPHVDDNGLAVAAEEHTGRRARTVYTITAAGQ